MREHFTIIESEDGSAFERGPELVSEILRQPKRHRHLVIESALEEKFWKQVYHTELQYEGSESQVEIGRYRVDALFIIYGKRIAVELDGRQFHDEHKDAARDKNLLLTSLDAAIRIPGAALWHFPNATFQVLGSWYPRFAVPRTLDCLSEAEMREEIRRGRESESFDERRSVEEWLRDSDGWSEVWAVNGNIGRVSSARGFLDGWNLKPIVHKTK